MLIINIRISHFYSGIHMSSLVFKELPFVKIDYFSRLISHINLKV